MPQDHRDPQVDLVRRYARILRSAPAEAWRHHRTTNGPVRPMRAVGQPPSDRPPTRFARKPVP